MVCSPKKVFFGGLILTVLYIFSFSFTQFSSFRHKLSTTNINLQNIAIEDINIYLQDQPSPPSSPPSSQQQQSCKIPKLNPFHPDIMSFVDVNKKIKDCDLKTLSDVTDDGKLVVVNGDLVSSAKYAYIVRTGKDSQTLTAWNVFYSDDKKGEVQLTLDFVKVIIKLKNGNEVEESHMFPVRSFEKHPRQNRSGTFPADKLNIIFLEVDSLSHSGAVRFLPKHYKYLNEDPDSVIMQGETVVGDGTTSQLIAMLIGDFEGNLPEARKNMPNTGSVSRWPFIFNDYHKKGYVTMYSEDSSASETFALRLNGFSQSPTTKYFRNFWMASSKMTQKLHQNSKGCINEITMRYLKRLLIQYKDYPLFSFSAINLAHDVFANAQLIDNDFQDMNKFLEKENLRQNTMIVYLGDHGARSSAYRATMTGKLEERLPFMAFSFPRWFKEKYPVQFKTFQENSKILTSHFDIYSTLKHLMQFPKEYTQKDKYGKSLFTNISMLDRSCTDAGVKEHWCPCIQYKPVDIQSDLAKSLANYLVKSINEKANSLQESKELCSEVTLKNISRVQQMKTNDKVKAFQDSFRKGCDGCGWKFNKNNDFTTYSFEIVIYTNPGDALFETTAVMDLKTKDIKIGNEISRLNMYREQPHCIAGKYPHLRKFCYCKTQL